MNFFNKVKTGASNFFQKVGQNSQNIYKKVSNGINDFNNNIINKGIDIGKKIANGLEKYSPSIANAASGIAAAVGLPELSPALMLGGQRLSDLGSRLGSNINNFQNRKNTIENHVADIKNKLRPPVMG